MSVIGFPFPQFTSLRQGAHAKPLEDKPTVETSPNASTYVEEIIAPILDTLEMLRDADIISATQLDEIRGLQFGNSQAFVRSLMDIIDVVGRVAVDVKTGVSANIPFLGGIVLDPRVSVIVDKAEPRRPSPYWMDDSYPNNHRDDNNERYYGNRQQNGGSLADPVYHRSYYENYSEQDLSQDKINTGTERNHSNDNDLVEINAIEGINVQTTH